MLLNNQVALITGAAQGIGRAIAEKFAANGAQLVLADLKPDNLENTAAAIRSQYACEAITCTVDVSRVDEVNAMVDKAQATFGRLDILVNNAGIGRPSKAFEDLSPEEWSATLGVNLMGAVYCAQAVLPIMRKQQYGRIISMASLAGQIGGMAVDACYSVSKAGIICLTKCLAKSTATQGITVNCIAPGLIVTPMAATLAHNPALVPMQRSGTPDEVADSALFLASDMARYITGTTMDVNGGLHMH